MEQKTVLLNGGREVDVAPVAGADAFLAGLLGRAPVKPVAPTLRVLKDAQGQPSVAIFVGSRHVGFLTQAVDQELLLTLQACDLNGAVARARGRMEASYENPGRVMVKVSLAESDQLLTPPPAEALPPVAESAPAPLPQAEGPEWPPPPPPPARPAQPARPVQPAQPTPRVLNAWSGAGPQPVPTAQEGWLGSSAQSGSVAQPTAAAANKAWSDAQEQTDPWLGADEKADQSGGESMEGWSARPSVAPAVSRPAPAETSHRLRAFVVSALVLVVLATAGFFVWKTQFATKTYTDPEYGYSFSYPAGWHLKQGSAIDMSGTADQDTPSDCVHVVDPNGSSTDLYGFDLFEVDVYEMGTALDESMMPYLREYLQASFTQSMAQDPTASIIEPLSETTVAGMSGYKVTISGTTNGTSLVATCYCLVYGTLEYDLLLQSSTENWESNQAVFDAFVASFTPGGVRQ